MVQQSRHISLILVCALAVAWWGILNGRALRSPQDVGGQARRSPLGVVGETVPVTAGGTGTVPVRIADLGDTLAQTPPLDSLEIEMLWIEIEKAEETANTSSFWRRILPQIHLSASFGLHDILFVDPTSYTPYILPKDAYRMTISLPLNDVLISLSHTQATLELERLRAMLSLRSMQYNRTRKMLKQQFAACQDDLGSLEQEADIIGSLLRFNQLRFDQGKIEYDALAKTKMELLAVERSIHRLQLQQSEIRLKLYGQ